MKTATMVLGSIVRRRGMVGPMIWSGARSPRDIEKSLGFGIGRLSAGYYLLLLKQPLRANDIQMDGTTLRSGGRLGLPSGDPASDLSRPKVQDGIDPHTLQHWRGKLSGSNTALSGTDRLCKVVPVTGHSDQLPPSEQYPPGGGGGQWTLLADYDFLVATFVDAGGTAHTPRTAGITVSVLDGASYDGRARLARWLANA